MRAVTEKLKYFPIQQEKLVVLDTLHKFLLQFLGTLEKNCSIRKFLSKYVRYDHFDNMQSRDTILL